MARGELRLVYSVTEAAELLGISRSTAYELVSRGELPTVRLGRRLIVTRPALTALLGVEPPLPGDLDRRRALNLVTQPAGLPHQADPPSAD